MFFLKSLTNLQSFENLCALRYFKRGTFVNHLVTLQFNINSRISLKLLQILKYPPVSLTVLQRTSPAPTGVHTVCAHAPFVADTHLVAWTDMLYWRTDFQGESHFKWEKPSIPCPLIVRILYTIWKKRDGGGWVKTVNRFYSITLKLIPTVLCCQT